MIQLEEGFKIEEVVLEETLNGIPEHMVIRPSVVNARVYKLKSGFIKHSIYITLGYIVQNKQNRPIEIFINSKDLTKNAEYAVLTRLISAIFRKTSNPAFILEELSSIHDPNGGYFKEGKYVHSFYAEIANVMKQFFDEIKLDGGNGKTTTTSIKEIAEPSNELDAQIDPNKLFQICPECGQKTAKIENGCISCVSPECGYSKCDK